MNTIAQTDPPPKTDRPVPGPPPSVTAADTLTVTLTRTQAEALEYAGRHVSSHLYAGFHRNVKVWALDEACRLLRGSLESRP